MRIAIIEDEKRSRKRLLEQIRTFENDSGMVLDCSEFRSGVDFVNSYQPVWDVIFMDIELPVMNGINAAGQIRSLDIEAAEQVKDPSRRFLSVNIRSHERMAFIRIENCFETTPVFRNGLPVTTKSNPAAHGYGTQSIKAIAKRCGGHVQMTTEDSIFMVIIFLPIR